MIKLKSVIENGVELLTALYILRQIKFRQKRIIFLLKALCQGQFEETLNRVRKLLLLVGP